MREIKFKFYDQNKEWRFCINYTTLDDLENQDSWQWPSPWERIAEAEYIGLKDINKKEIYEWDIMKVKWCENDIFVVKFWSINDRDFEWNLSCFYLENSDWEILYIDIDENEVIGNIYENPELLKNNLWN